jgi:hypothetical protein
MKTTLEIPDPIFRRAKSAAAKLRIPLRRFVTEAVKDKLAAEAKTSEKPWVKHMGKLKHLRKETERVNRLIEEESEEVDLQARRRQSMQAVVGLWKNRKKQFDSQTYIRRLRKGKRLRRLAS